MRPQPVEPASLRVTTVATAPLDAVIAGSVQAFGEVFDAHAVEVLAFCRRRCLDVNDAEDLMSVVFLEAWRCHSRAILVDGSLRPWLYGIASNVMANAARARRRHAAALARFHAANPDAEPATDHAEAVAWAAATRELRSELQRAFAKLSTKERAVAELVLVEHLDVASAAIVLGIPEGTVKSRLHRARQRLVRLLRSSELPEVAELLGLGGHEQDEQRLVAPLGSVKAS
jgi:RNA polymerase sigma factor (sigma-70 family)